MHVQVTHLKGFLVSALFQTRRQEKMQMADVAARLLPCNLLPVVKGIGNVDSVFFMALIQLRALEDA